MQSGVALAASPVSAAMAAMLTLTDDGPYNLGLTEILAITLPACIVGIIVTSLVVNRMGKELADDPEVQEKIRAGLLPPISAAHGPSPEVAAARGRHRPTGLPADAAPTADAGPSRRSALRRS